MTQAHKEDAAEMARLLADARDHEPCEDGHCCCCGPGEPCCDCGEIMPDPAAEATALREGLHLFREFVIRNATQWRIGAGVPGHPMWAHVAELLGSVPDITSGPDWRFVLPHNERTLADLRAWADEDLGGCDCSAGFGGMPDHARSCPMHRPEARNA